MNDMTSISSGEVGRSLPRLEANAKVTGRVEYVHTMRLPGMLTAKLVRRRSRTAASSRSIPRRRCDPGVERVVTIADIIKIIPHPYYGPAFHDQPILAMARCITLVSP